MPGILPDVSALQSIKEKLKPDLHGGQVKLLYFYPVAILQGVLLILLLHVFDGFTPVEMTKTILFAKTDWCMLYIYYVISSTLHLVR